VATPTSVSILFARGREPQIRPYVIESIAIYMIDRYPSIALRQHWAFQQIYVITQEVFTNSMFLRPAIIWLLITHNDSVHSSGKFCAVTTFQIGVCVTSQEISVRLKVLPAKAHQIVIIFVVNDCKSATIQRVKRDNPHISSKI
jgi:hypothetical protein